MLRVAAIQLRNKKTELRVVERRIEQVAGLLGVMGKLLSPIETGVTPLVLEWEYFMASMGFCCCPAFRGRAT